MSKELKYVTLNGIFISKKLAKSLQKKRDERENKNEFWFWCTERPKLKKKNVYLLGKNGNPLCVYYYKHNGNIKKINLNNWTNEANRICSIHGQWDSEGYICSYKKK